MRKPTFLNTILAAVVLTGATIEGIAPNVPATQTPPVVGAPGTTSAQPADTRMPQQVEQESRSGGIYTPQPSTGTPSATPVSTTTDQ
jgi:hypothetical protein